MSNPPLQWFIDVHAVHAPLSLSYEANKHELEGLKRYAEVEDVISFSSELKFPRCQRGNSKSRGD